MRNILFQKEHWKQEQCQTKEQAEIINHCLLTIDKDLDRLEELEKENELLKKNLEQLETLKDNVETGDVVHEANGHVMFSGEYLKMTTEENFDLLKEDY